MKLGDFIPKIPARVEKPLEAPRAKHRLPRANSFAVVRTHDKAPKVRLRAPKFWFEGFTHFRARKVSDRLIALKLLTEPGHETRSIIYLGAETQLTCRFDITDLVPAETFPMGTRLVNSQWHEGINAVLVDLSREPSGPQWPRWSRSVYAAEGFDMKTGERE